MDWKGEELKLPVCAGLGGVVFRQGTDNLSAVHGEVEGILLGVVEDHSPEALARGEIDVNNGVLRARNRLDGSLDQVRSAWGQDLDGNVVGDRAGGLDQASRKVEVGVGGRREGHLDFLEAGLAEDLEEAPFLLSVL